MCASPGLSERINIFMMSLVKLSRRGCSEQMEQGPLVEQISGRGGKVFPWCGRGETESC